MIERREGARKTINLIEKIQSLPDKTLFLYNPGYTISFGGDCNATLSCSNSAYDKEFSYLMHSVLTKHILAGLEELKGVIEEQIMGSKIYDDE